MDLEKINEIAYKLMGNRKAHNEREIGGIYYHGQRTASLAIELRKLINLNDNSNDDIIMAACILHDCGKGIEPHGIYGAIIAEEAIKDIVTPLESTVICEIIYEHNNRKPDSCDLSEAIKIVQDADMIDHFGTYEIWMNINYYVHTNGTIQDMIYYYREHHESFIEKNRKLINYDISKNIFDDRVKFQKSYISRLTVEGNGGIYHKDRMIKNEGLGVK